MQKWAYAHFRHNPHKIKVDYKLSAPNFNARVLSLPLAANMVDSAPFGAGWSSLAARRAHNPKVVGSNPTPATNYYRTIGYPAADGPKTRIQKAGTPHSIFALPKDPAAPLKQPVSGLGSRCARSG